MFARRALVIGCCGLLVIGTGLVFGAFDRDSHSASDTLRPFLITMAPVWAVFALGARALWRGAPRP